MIQITITETGRSSLKDNPEVFNKENLFCNSIVEAKETIAERYGRMPNGRNKVYRDKDGVSRPCGFVYSFWNSDISHNSKAWYQTDWITFEHITKKTIDPAVILKN